MRIERLIRTAWLALATTMCTEPMQAPEAIAYGCSAQQQLHWGPCSAQPVRVAGEHRFTELSSGAAHTCGLVASGDLYCWGASTNGAAGAASDARKPVRVNSTVPFVSVTAGGQHTCALSATGAAYCWGATDATGLTSFANTCAGSQPCALTPTPTAQGLAFRLLRAGNTHTCGISTEGSTWCWGWNTTGEVGAGEPGSSRTAPQMIAGGFVFGQLESRFRFNCGLTQAGAMHCWGWGQEGQLGTTALSSCTLAIMNLLCSSIPVPASTQARFSSISLGSAFGCGLDNGTIHCWGENGQGQLGRSTPGPGVAPIPASGAPWTGIGAGYFHACGIRSDRSAHCWGSNPIGALGTGSTAHSTPEPAPVTGGLHFAQIVAGRDHTCGLTPEGIAWCWGSDRFGQLGRGP